MAAVRKTVSLHEKTVQKAATDVVIAFPNKRQTRRPRNSRVKVKHWYDGVDPLLVAWVRHNKIHWRRVEVISSTELIIHEENQ